MRVPFAVRSTLVGPRTLWWLAPLVTLAMGGGAAAADFRESEIDSAKGISGVRVVVDAFDDEERMLGVEAPALKERVEAQLRLAGVRVLTDDEFLADERSPVLAARVVAIPVRQGWAGTCRLELAQRVSTLGTGVKATATTWSWTAVITGLRGDMGQTMKCADQGARSFANLLLTANPRQRGEEVPR